MQITNLYNKEGSLEDARPKSFGSEFFRTVDLGQQYDTVSHFGGIVFIQFNNPLWCIILGVIRYSTLPSCSSYWTFTLVHYTA